MFFFVQIFLPICHEKHWSLYVFNFSSQQIDILDSRKLIAKEKKKYHEKVNSKIRTGLYDALKVFTDDRIISFKEWSFPIIPVSTQESDSNDCAFFVMKFSKEYDADGGTKRSCIFEQVICLPIYSSLIDLANHLIFLVSLKNADKK